MFRFVLYLSLMLCIPSYSYAMQEDLPNFVNEQDNVDIPFVGTIGQSASWGDYNLDGWPDLFISNGDRHKKRSRRIKNYKTGAVDSRPSPIHKRAFLFKNKERKFEDSLKILGIPNRPFRTAAWADYNNDGFLDLLLGTIKAGHPVQLYKNIDGLYFINVTDEAGINKLGSTASHGIWGDFDNDGNVDLFQAGLGLSYLYKNNGDGTFEEVSKEVGVNASFISNSALWFDLNNDGYLDLYLVNYGENVMYQNLGNGTFIDITDSSGLGGHVSWKSTAACSGDYNEDGFIDLYITNIGRARGNALYKNNGDGTFTNITFETNTNDVGDGRTCAWIDFDADGKLDLFTTNHTYYNRLYKNLGGDVFKDVAPSVGLDEPRDVFSASWADYNLDGYYDVFLIGHMGSGLMKNGGNSNNSITLNLIGDGLLSNSSAIGARVEVITSSGTQVREVSGGRGGCEQDMLPVYFGLGQNDSVNVNIKWPSGKVCSFKDLSVEDVNYYTVHEVKCEMIPYNKTSE